jgi:hypothetical protein
MALPNLNTEKYSMTLPSTGKKLSFRPFLVKEEQVLLLAQEAGKINEMTNALKTIIKNCTFGKVEVDNLPFFDLEYMFIKIRSKSVGEISNIKVTCPDDNETQVPVEVNLEEIEMVVDDKHTNKIELTDDVTVLFDYPTLASYSQIKTESYDDMMKILADCISEVHNGEEVFSKSDMGSKEKIEFLENLNRAQFNKVQTFFETMPKVSKTIEIVNPKTEVKSKLTLEGMQSFF